MATGAASKISQLVPLFPDVSENAGTNAFRRNQLEAARRSMGDLEADKFTDKYFKYL